MMGKTANEKPFIEGSRVSIIRSRRGWLNGSVTGEVISRFQNGQGTWSYIVQGEDGHKHEVLHTRDISRA